MVSRAINTAYSTGGGANGLWRAIVQAVNDNSLNVTIPRLGQNNVYENVPYIGFTPQVGDRIWVGFIEGRSFEPVAFIGATDTSTDITEIVAGTNLNGGGSGGSVTVNLDDDITLSTVTADGFYGDLYGAIHILVKNVSGGSLTKGTPVYATGAVGASGAVEVEASLAGTGSTMPAMGLLDQDLDHNGEGDVVVSGVLQNFDTDTPGYSVGDELYVAPSGGLTTTRPTGSSELVQKIGKVIRVQQNTGEILVQGAGRTNDVPNSFSITGDMTVGGDATVTGDLTVNGTTVTLNTETLTVEDNIIVLNSNVSGAPSLDAGIEVERGSSSNVSFLWDESNDRWTLGSESLVAGTFIGAVTGDVTGNVTGNVTATNITTDTLTTTAWANFDSGTLYVDASNNRVGINTSSPGLALSVDGDVDIIGTARAIKFGRQDEGGPHGLEYHFGGAMEGALYYRSSPNSWSFEDGSGTKIVEFDTDDALTTFGGNVTSAHHFTAQSGGADGGIVLGQTYNSGYVGLRTAGMGEASANEYVIMSDGSTTFMSAATNGDVYIRGGANNSSCQIALDTSANNINVTGNLSVAGRLEAAANGSELLTLRDTGGTDTGGYISFEQSGGTRMGYMGYGNNDDIHIKNDNSGGNMFFGVQAGWAAYFNTNRDFVPYTDNTHDLGSSSLHWAQVHAERYYTEDSDTYIEYDGDSGSGIDGPGIRFVVNNSEMFKMLRENNDSAHSMLTFGENNDGILYEKDNEKFTFYRGGASKFEIEDHVYVKTSNATYLAANPNTGTGNDAEWAAPFGIYILYRNSSLAAEKENITDDLGEWLTADMIDQVVPKMWNRIHAPGIPEIGPIADEMEMISPFLAAHGTTAEGEQFLTGINKTAYLSLLVLAVKDLRSQVATLTTRLEALEAE